MLGRNLEYWRGLLQSASVPHRLYAMRVARQMGKEGARLLLDSAGSLPEWPLVWALQGCAHPASLRRAAPHTPARLAYCLQRRFRRSQKRSTRHSLETCLRGLREAENPHLRLSWALVILENHSERAFEGIVGLVSTPLPQRQKWELMSAVCAWALSQLGPSILFPLQERFRTSHPTIQQWFCQALWYLGPQAQGCESFVANTTGVWTSALLHSLEGAGTRTLVQRGECPIWIDKSSLGRLATLVTSGRKEDRLYVARALPGWGPALPNVAQPLEGLVADAEPEIREAAWRGLEGLGGVVSASALRAGLQARELPVRQAALTCFRANYEQEPVTLLEEQLGDPELSLLSALAIQVSGVQPDQVPTLFRILPRLNGLALFVALGALAEAPVASAPPTADLTALMKSPQVDVRQATARLLMASGTPGHEMLPFCEDSDSSISQQVTEYLLERGQPEELLPLLSDGPRLSRRLAMMESRSIISQMVRRGSSGSQVTPLLARLQELTHHHDPEVHKAAARLLRTQSLDTISWGDLDSADPHVHQAVTNLLRQQGAFPDGLRAAMLEGLYILPFTLNLALSLLPPERASALFWSAFAKASRERRSYFLDPLQQLGGEGWQLILSLVDHPEPEVAEDAVGLLLRWLERNGKEALEGPDLLRKPSVPSARRQLAVGLSEALLAAHQPLESRWLPWAVELVRCPDFHAACPALQALGRYHLRSQEAERVPSLQGILRAANHPHKLVRLEALAQLRLLSLSDEERWESVTVIRAFGQDPEPQVQALRLLWLQQVEELTTSERLQVQQLRLEADDQELQDTLQLLV